MQHGVLENDIIKLKHFDLFEKLTVYYLKKKIVRRNHDGKHEIRGLLEKLNQEQLFDFLEQYAENDAKFAIAVNVHFCRPEFDKELSKIKEEIKCAFYGVSDYQRHDSWGNVYIDTSSIISEINQRMNQGHIRLAFAQVELLYRKSLDNFEYQGECEISDIAEYCLLLMSEIAEKTIVDEDKEYIFKHCILLAKLKNGKDYGADYEHQLLKVALNFATLENRSELDDVLECIDNKWNREEIKLIQLELIRKLEDENTVKDFIYHNLELKKIREIAFEETILSKDFVEAERLCIDALATINQRYGISSWMYKLYSVYEMMENTAKLIETAQNILFAGDLEYYNKLKSLLIKQNTWDNMYLALLNECKEKLDDLSYMEILSIENEYSLLLEQLKENTLQIYHYGKILAEKYPDDVSAIFIERISKEAELARDRKNYQEVCRKILIFAKAGYKAEITNIINEFKGRYKNRPAFINELSKI